jgi:hypothetical protein
MKRTSAAIKAALTARYGGATMRQAAAAAGVHLATLCRWQASDPKLRAAFNVRLPSRARPRPQLVPIYPDCPKCGAPYVVRSPWHSRLATFWGCSRWPRCRWASWRPRFPDDCPTCRGPRYYSKSRLSCSCPTCGVRWEVTYRRKRRRDDDWLA